MVPVVVMETAGCGAGLGELPLRPQFCGAGRWGLSAERASVWCALLVGGQAGRRRPGLSPWDPGDACLSPTPAPKAARGLFPFVRPPSAAPAAAE